ncbi:uncharacterized protein LOC123308479 [Coccinella septempunctata]|uniref:uncharacterized protein LOC123308479 n=1 Tax=Coccinella septempunctata TaxID=41139 RepID=UPI001D05E6D5|nr:uncharacterized protein LOC123308479 [Coccinella septempunctata]
MNHKIIVKPYGDPNVESEYIPKEGIVKNKINFWEEHSRKLLEKHSVMNIPKENNVRKKFKLAESGNHSCSGPCTGFYFNSRETLTSTGSSDFPSTSSGITSLSRLTSESGNEFNENRQPNEDDLKFDGQVQSQANTVREIGINTSYGNISDNAEMDEAIGPILDPVLEWNYPKRFQDEMFLPNEDILAEFHYKFAKEVQPTRSLLSKIHRTVTMYVKEIVLAYVFFRSATIIYFWLW